MSQIMEVSVANFSEVHSLSFPVIATTLGLVSGIHPDQETAIAKHTPGREVLAVIAATDKGEILLMEMSALQSVEDTKMALEMRRLRALAFVVMPIPAMALYLALDSALLALKHEGTVIEKDEDPTVLSFLAQLIKRSDVLPVDDLATDPEGAKWGTYIDPIKGEVAVHVIDENAGDSALGTLIGVFKAKDPSQLRLTVEVISGIRIEKEMERNSIRSLADLFGPMGAIVIGGEMHGDEGAKEGRESMFDSLFGRRRRRGERSSDPAGAR